MAFQMKDSPHKRGEIQGTESALKVKSWIIKQVAKNAPKVINKIDDAWVATRDAIFGGGKKTVKNVSTKTKNVKKVRFGDPNMSIKSNIPSRKRSFMARMGGVLKKVRGQKTLSPAYWSLYSWRNSIK